MDIARTKELTSGCVKTHLATVWGDEYIPLPVASLSELLEANEIVAAQPPERINGGVRLHTHCDPRIVALHYAYEQYGSSPEQMLEALGCELTRK